MKKILSLLLTLAAAGLFFSCKPDKNEQQPTPEPPAPSKVSVTGISLSNPAIELQPGETFQLTAIVQPDNATDKTVEWSSSNTSVATVDQTGKITAAGAGSATITAKTKDGGKTATASVTVKAGTVAVTGVTIDKDKLDLEPGEKAALTATVAPENATNRDVEWSSSDNKVATVDAKGVVTAVGPGTATITVKTKDGGKTAKVTVTVKAGTVAVTGVELERDYISLRVDESIRLTAIVKPENASNKAVTWTTNNAAVVTVDNEGLCVGKKAGTATVTVHTADGNKTASCRINVIQESVPVTGVSINKTGVGISVGESLQLTATVQPANATDNAVAWSSSNESVATVDANGKVTAKKAGTTTITVTTNDQGKTATCKIFVTDDTQYAMHYLGAKIISLTYSIGVNPDDYLPFRLYDEKSGSYLNPKDVSMTTSNSSVANPISRTASQLNIFAKKAGTATLTFTLEGKVIAIVDATINAPAVTYAVYYGDSEVPSEITHKLGSTEKDWITLRLYNKTTKQFVNPKYLIVSTNPADVVDRGSYNSTEYHLYAKKAGTAVVSFRVGAQTLKSLTVHVTGSGS